MRLHIRGLIKELLSAPPRCGSGTCIYTYACDLHTDLWSCNPSGHVCIIPL